MRRKEWLVSYIDPNQNLICFRLTTENTFKAFEKISAYVQYLKERYPAAILRWNNWFCISNLSIIPISRSQFRSIPSATTVRYYTELANRVLKYGRSHWERHYINIRMKGGH